MPKRSAIGLAASLLLCATAVTATTAPTEVSCSPQMGGPMVWIVDGDRVYPADRSPGDTYQGRAEVTGDGYRFTLPDRRQADWIMTVLVSRTTGTGNISFSGPHTPEYERFKAWALILQMAAANMPCRFTTPNR